MASVLLLRDGVPRIKFSLGDVSAMGRSSRCEVQLLDPQLSRRHAQIVRRGEKHWLVDLGSHNGTFLGGERISGEVRLSSGDEICLGGSVLIFDPPMELLHDPHGDSTICLVDEEHHGGDLTEGTPGGELSSDAIGESIFSIFCDLVSVLEPELLFPKMLESFMDHFGADRGFVILMDEGGRFRPVAVRSGRKVLALSRALVNRVIDRKAPVLVGDALEDVSFVGSRSVVEHRLRSVMVAPLLLGGTVTGIVQLDNARSGAFDDSLLERLMLLGRVASIATENALRFDRQRRRQAAGSTRVGEADGTGLVGEDESILQLLKIARKAAASPARVLISGESGTGKELVARIIHENSARADRPMVAINCGAMPEGLLESELFGHEKGAFTGASKKRRGCFALADGGTLFLDEVGELSQAMQVKLLRVLQEGTFFPLGSERPVTVDVRVIAATNRSLASLVAEGQFREDLFFRLNVIELEVPPLRQRAGDIHLLLDHFLQGLSRKLGKPVPEVSDEAMKALVAYRWPGNVRELQNMAERLVVLSDGGVGAADLPGEISAARSGKVGSMADGLDLKGVLAQTEREVIVRALEKTRGKKAAACRLLGISRPTLDKKIADYGLEV